MTKTVSVIQHHPSIHLGNLAPVLRERGYEIRYLDATRLDPTTLRLDCDLLIVLGGPMGVYESAQFPFIATELAVIRLRLDAKQPTFGICLGAQMMAGALGEQVYPGEVKAIGYRQVQLTEAGLHSPMRHLSDVPMLEWHGDTFDLPAGVTRLAGSAGCRNEAFSIGRFALAVQFHPEATEDMHDRWVERDADELNELGLDLAELRRRNGRFGAHMQDASHAMFTEWLDGLAALGEEEVSQ